jgi:hypothetical protein
MTNKERALKVQKLLGLKQEDNENEYYRVADVICDLIHFCDLKKINFLTELERGEDFYSDERGKE